MYKPAEFRLSLHVADKKSLDQNVAGWQAHCIELKDELLARRGFGH